MVSLQLRSVSIAPCVRLCRTENMRTSHMLSLLCGHSLSPSCLSLSVAGQAPPLVSLCLSLDKLLSVLSQQDSTHVSYCGTEFLLISCAPFSEGDIIYIIY